MAPAERRAWNPTLTLGTNTWRPAGPTQRPARGRITGGCWSSRGRSRRLNASRYPEHLEGPQVDLHAAQVLRRGAVVGEAVDGVGHAAEVWAVRHLVE